MEHSMSLGESSRNMFHNIRVLSTSEASTAPLKDMGSVTEGLQLDPAPRKSRRRYLGMKPPRDFEGDGLFRV